MKTQSKPTTLLLAIIAALLAANLIVNLSPQEATARPVANMRTVVGMAIADGTAWRLWSDGVMESRQFGTARLLPGNTGGGKCWRSWGGIGPNAWIKVEKCTPQY